MPLKVNAKGKVFKRPASFHFTIGDDHYEGYLQFEEGLSIDDIVHLFDESIQINDSIKFEKLQFAGLESKQEARKTNFIKVKVGAIEAGVMSSSIKVAQSKNEQKVSVFALNIPEYELKGIPGLEIPNFKPIKVSLSAYFATDTAEVIINNKGQKQLFPKGFSIFCSIDIPDHYSNKFAFPQMEKRKELLQKREKELQTIEVNEVNQENPAIAPKPVKASNSISWSEINKKIGPLMIRKVGYEWKDGKVWLAISADFSMMGLTMSLRGFRMGFPLKWPIQMPEIGFDGLGILFKSKAFTIGGLLVKYADQTLPNGTRITNQFVGAIIIKTKAFGIFGVCAYAKMNDKTSIFVYAYLDKTLGGPPFFLVQGLGLGFGYNRQVIIPSVDRVNTFPLVQQAMGTAPSVKGGEGDLLNSLAEDLPRYFPPKENSLFFVIGVKFTSFKLVDGFVLMSIALDNGKFRMDILGLARLSLPPMVGSPMAVLEIAIKVTFIPDDGVLAVDGLITNRSFVLSKNARLTGGFAFYSWFKGSPHEGDFVLTLGGYHSRFRVPSHYPKPSRIGLNWQVTRNLSIKSGFYFALTPSAVMAGGSLKVVYNTDNLYAAFLFAADFLLQWKPFYYDIRVRVGISIRVRVGKWGVYKTFELDLSVDLHIWGPKFSGKATIRGKVWGIRFSYGLEFGAGASKPPLLTWQEFKQGFLPPKNTDVLTLAVTNGVIRKEKDKNNYTVNPKELELRLESVIPSNLIFVSDRSLQQQKKLYQDNQPISAYPTFFKKIDASILFLARQGTTYIVELEKMFEVTRIEKNLPAALWSREHVDLNSSSTVKNMLCGIKLKAKTPETGAVSELPTKNLSFNLEENQKDEKDDVFNMATLLQSYKGKLNLLEEDGTMVTTKKRQTAKEKKTSRSIYDSGYLRSEPIVCSIL